MTGEFTHRKRKGQFSGLKELGGTTEIQTEVQLGLARGQS